MRIPLNETQARLPLPASATWPAGVWDIQAFAHGSMSVILFAPRGTDHQSSHEQDELYIVLKGNGVLVIDDSRHSFAAGDALFVPANTDHRFVEFTNDLVTWAVFWGPKGGESQGA
jgi:mannose-6-phosphate isomerase-like protein (cupin superfamily)